MIATWRKLAVFWILCACSFVTVTLCLRSYSVAISNFGDSASYLNVARAIASWHFEGLQVLQFWGVSYAIALVALLGHVPLTASLIIVSAGSSAAVTVLAGRLWGWYAAVFTTAVSFDWMQRSMLGGSEPLFLLLLLTAFLAIRRGHWWIAALLASFATTVRPLGICALAAIGLILLYRKEYGRFCSALITGLLVGLLYMLPLHIYLHDSMATVHSYETARPLFGIPFYAILQGLFLPHPFTNLVLSCSWVIFIITGIALLSFSRSGREFRRAHPAEFLFAVLYQLLQLSKLGAGEFCSIRDSRRPVRAHCISTILSIPQFDSWAGGSTTRTDRVDLCSCFSSACSFLSLWHSEPVQVIAPVAPNFFSRRLKLAIPGRPSANAMLCAVKECCVFAALPHITISFRRSMDYVLWPLHPSCFSIFTLP